MELRLSSSLLGREQEVSRIRDWLGSGQTRLVTVTGPGGVGKTRVAGEVADALRGEGWLVHWRELVELRDGESLVGVLGGHPPLSVGPTLVVVDGCDRHLGEVAAWLDNFHAELPSTWSVVVTSRSSLGVPGERVLQLDPLDEATATELFYQRAGDWGAALRGDGAEIELVSQLTMRLDGLPLAIELAAARCRALDVGQILLDLSRGLDVLSGGDAGAPPRHRTMQATIAWSHERLTRDEQTVLRRLAVFVGGARLVDIEAVVGQGMGASRVHHAMSGLVRQSLVVAVEESGTRRYIMLDLIRMFALRELVRSGEQQHVGERHTVHFRVTAAEFARGLGAHWDPGRAAAAVGSLGNLQRTIDVLTATGRLDEAARVLWDTQHLWGNAGPLAVEPMIAGLMARQSTPAQALLIHTAAATIWVDQGNVPAATESATSAWAAALELDPAHGDALLQVAAIRAQAYRAAFAAPDANGAAEGLLRAAIPECLRVGDHDGAVFARAWLSGSVGIFEGEVGRGVPLAREALADAIACGHPVLVAWASCVLAELCAQRGLLDESDSHARRVHDTLDQAWPTVRPPSPSLPRMLATIAQGYCRILRGQEPLPGVDLAEASRSTERDGKSFEAYQFRYLRALDGLRRGEDAAALDDLVVARALAIRAGGWFAEMTAAAGALACVGCGDLDQAQAWLDGAGGSARPTPTFAARMAVAKSLLALRRDETSEAEALAIGALGIAVAQELALETAQLFELVALSWGGAGRSTDATRLAGAAARLREGHGLQFGPRTLVDTLDEGLSGWRASLGAEAFSHAWMQGGTLDTAAGWRFVQRRRGPRQRPHHGWTALSPAEVEVALAVAAGLTTPEIAARLLVSPETVKTHLSHIFAKLGVQRRSQVAALAAEHQTDGRRPHPGGGNA